ncbi:FeoB-associated Cys-rich membrane protein [Campylobacter sp. FMV-PI01]|uniref:FeoB-associated Cys-rich membrane protein n=1 Tax=Campylobacter portucalensis TaxID=2608384 RepID=A0A6L5WID2_9BACT|nr:FeoB-associated Cys-rich membrane protein [Campylobacter portucalensis]MSN96686.1 FeoB-associated Cys-rich membrane protein [Campylobacter portucalensis]
MKIYELVILLILAGFAGYYVYKKLFKSSGCGCGKSSCNAKKNS